MTNPSNPNPNRRRRLTADELIAIVVALTGIGSILFWGLGIKNNSLNLLQGNPLALNTQSANRTVGLLDGDSSANLSVEGQNLGQAKTAVRAPQTQTNADNNSVAIAPPNTGNVNPGIVGGIAAAPLVSGIVTAQSEQPAKIDTTPTAESAPSPVAQVPEFKDVPKAFWGETYVSELQKRGILDDFGSGKFEPDRPITRGEYAKMLDRAFGNRRIEDRKIAFKDIPSTYPRKEAIDKSVKLGFMSGYSANKFAPNEQIPRYQMQISLAKGLNLPIPANPVQILSKFADAKKMPTYAKDKMSAAIAAGLVVKDEKPDALKPVQKATRADAAALIYQSLVKEGVIQPQTQTTP